MRNSRKVLLVIFLATCLAIGFFVYKAKRMEQGFSNIEIGSSLSTVIKLLGSPSLVLMKDEQSEEYASIFMEKHPKIEVGYFYSARVAQFYAIGFDENKVVIAKYNFVSY